MDKTNAALTARLRDRVVGELHLGRIHAGDRLPGIRDVSAETGLGHRAVVRAYRALEAEGLVEVRGRSGVYVAPQERLGRELLGETAGWLAGVLSEALKRRIPIPGLPDFVRRCTAAVHPRVACLESTEDHLAVICSELREEFGFDASSLDLRRLRGSGEVVPDGLPKELRSAELIVTTTLHASAARALAEALGVPLVLITVHPEIAATLERRVREGTLIVVCADPAFGERIRSIYGGADPARVRVVTADDAASMRALDPEEPVLLTLAARRRLGETPLQSLLPHSPTISPQSARELAELLVRLNVAKEHA